MIFLLSTRFLFQNLDRVQLYDLKSKLLADTDTLDLAQDIFDGKETIFKTPLPTIGIKLLDKIGGVDTRYDEMAQDEMRCDGTG